MQTLLPNLRLLGLPSMVGGKDFAELCVKIDQTLEGLGFDLAEEAVFLFFNAEGECRVGRPVIGPLRDCTPFLLWDWSAHTMQKKAMEGMWSEVEELQEEHSGRELIIRLVRRLTDGRLSLTGDAYVHVF